jgi:hypothetical protein
MLLRAFGTLAPTLRLVGGLVPRYLTPDYADKIEVLAELYAHRVIQGTHQDALELGLQALERTFCDDKDIVGFEKEGPAQFCAFHEIGEPGSEDRILEQRKARTRPNGLLFSLFKTKKFHGTTDGVGTRRIVLPRLVTLIKSGVNVAQVPVRSASDMVELFPANRH